MEGGPVLEVVESPTVTEESFNFKPPDDAKDTGR